MVSIPACQAGDPDSIRGLGDIFSSIDFTDIIIACSQKLYKKVLSSYVLELFELFFSVFSDALTRLAPGEDEFGLFEDDQNCINSGSNTVTLDLQFNALPTELLRQYMLHQIEKQLIQILIRLRVLYQTKIDTLEIKNVKDYLNMSSEYYGN